jgi:putative transposase
VAKGSDEDKAAWLTSNSIKERHRIERVFNELKQFRRVPKRYDNPPAKFMGFVKIAAIAIWLE